jgi:hypothetical protein
MSAPAWPTSHSHGHHAAVPRLKRVPCLGRQVDAEGVALHSARLGERIFEAPAPVRSRAQRLEGLPFVDVAELDLEQLPSGGQVPALDLTAEDDGVAVQDSIRLDGERGVPLDQQRRRVFGRKGRRRARIDEEETP